MNSILFDLDGVFYRGSQLIEGAARVASWARQQQIPHLYVTNTTSRPRSALVDKLSDLGIETTQDHILTPPVACVKWLQQELAGKQVALFVPDATRSEFDVIKSSDDEADDIAAVIVGDLGEGWDFATLNRAFRMLIKDTHPKLVALGMSRYWLAEDGLRLDVAPFVTALAYASDTQPIIMGKPAKAFFQSALQILDASAEDCLMVGDDIRSDIAGAQAMGIHTVLVKTGKFRPGDLELDIQADVVLDSIRDFPAWWKASRVS